MKNLVFLIALCAAIYDIHGCSNAQNDYAQYRNYLNGSGAVEGFVKGFQSGYNGDIATPILEGLQANQLQQLEAKKNSAKTDAWIWTSIACISALFVFGKSKT